MHVSLQHQYYFIEGNWSQSKMFGQFYVYIQTVKGNNSHQIEME